MSISTQITALTTDRNDIREALADKGVNASTHGFDDFADDIDSILAVSDVPSLSSSDLTVSGATVTAPAGYYASAASKSVASGSATTPATSLESNPTITVSAAGLITATHSNSVTVKPTVVAGYVSTGTAGGFSTNGTSTKQLDTQAATTFNTSTTDQKINKGLFLAGDQTIKAVTTSNISAGNIKSGVVVKVGDANDDDRITSATGTFTMASTVSTGQTAATASEIRSGYSAWVDGVEVKGSIQAKAAATYYTSTTDQTIAKDQFLSGAQTIKAVTTSNLSASNVKSGTTIKVGDANDDDRIASVTGTFTSSSTVSSGQTAAGSGQIVSGYSAWVDGNEVQGGIATRTFSDMTVAGNTVTAPAGYYASSSSASIADGSAKTPNTTIEILPTVSVNSSGQVTATNSATESITPTVTAGYVSSGTSGTITVTGTNLYQLTTKSAATYTPTASNQTINSGLYLTGVQTIEGDSNLIADNIVGGITIFGIAGTYGISTIGSYINVQYPEGASCSCTNGTTTIVLPNTSGMANFAIPSAGDWTLSCTDGNETASKTITVAANNIYDVTLAYSITRKYLTNTLTSYSSSTIQTIGDYAFSNRTALTSVEVSATSVGQYAFTVCTGLTTADFTSADPVTISPYAFNGCTELNACFIRSTTLSTLSNANAFNGTGIARGEGGIYVPASLLDSYKSASNWSTYANNIYPIGAYPVTDFSTISDSWTEIFAAEDNGTYSTKYSVGDTKQLVYNNTNVYAQIVAMDTDERSDGNGYAKITWILKPILELHKMNSTNTTSGGWAESEMRSYVRETCLARLPSDIQNRIVSVNKTYYDYSTTSTLSIADTVWIPSFYEVTGDSSGVNYPYLYGTYTYSQSAPNRVKYRLDNGSASIWWLRSAYNATYFRRVGNNGNANGNSHASDSNGLVLGFCT